MVAGAVAFDGQNQTARFAWVFGNHVNPELLGAELWNQLQPLSGQDIKDIRFEVVERNCGELSVTEPRALRYRVLKVVAQQLDAASGANLREIDIGVAERRDDG